MGGLVRMSSKGLSISIVLNRASGGVYKLAVVYD